MAANGEEAGKFNYLFGLINLIVTFCIVWGLWYVFMHADGVMKLYTPMYGFSLVAVLVAAIILLTKVLGWPASGEGAPAGNPLGMGIGGTILALALMFFIYYVVFWTFIGRLGVAYFSPTALVAGGGTGAEPYNAREWASTAILYFSTAFLWWALVWELGFSRWPWNNDSNPVVGWSRLLAVLILSIITYAILFHPHVCYLFPEAQKMAGVKAWWEDWAETSSAFYGLGIVMCTVWWVICSDLYWERYPWKRIGKGQQGSLARGIVTFVVTLALGLLTVWVLTEVFNYFWEEPFIGGQYTDGPDWRYIHMAEVAGFCILAAFIHRYYFNNFPNALPLWPRAIIRTIIGIGGGLLIYWFYYSSLSNFFLGKVEGWAQPDDKPLVWTLLFLAVILIQADFFKMWPIKGNKK